LRRFTMAVETLSRLGWGLPDLKSRRVRFQIEPFYDLLAKLPGCWVDDGNPSGISI
jgi:hypothetical protein